MPLLALAAALLILSGSTDLTPALAQPAGNLILAFDDEAYGDKDEDDTSTREPEDRGFNLYDDDTDEDGDSAHGPDDDDGWDIEEFERSERA
jgi:hypothetical protein